MQNRWFVGFGVVGQSLAKLLESRAEDLYVQYGIKPRIVGAIDSKGSARMFRRERYCI